MSMPSRIRPAEVRLRAIDARVEQRDRDAATVEARQRDVETMAAAGLEVALGEELRGVRRGIGAADGVDPLHFLRALEQRDRARVECRREAVHDPLEGVVGLDDEDPGRRGARARAAGPRAPAPPTGAGRRRSPSRLPPAPGRRATACAGRRSSAARRPRAVAASPRARPTRPRCRRRPEPGQRAAAEGHEDERDRKPEERERPERRGGSGAKTPPHDDPLCPRAGGRDGAQSRPYPADPPPPPPRHPVTSGHAAEA